jgi:hypothetical protein
MYPRREEIRPDPTVVLMDDLLDDIERGRLRVPVFQRPFVWRPEQMLSLFDSIERGYPIGSLLVWRTAEPVPWMTRIGGIEIPPMDRPGEVSYILDGHQRLSTLFGVLRRQGDLPRPVDPQDWAWWVYRDLRDRLGSERYRHHRHRPGEVPPEYLLPLRAVSRTMDFLRFSRELEIRLKDPERVTAMVREAEAVAQRIKSYKLTLVRLEGASLDQAVDVYTRLNRTGTRMDADQMVSALTHRQDQPTLASRIDDIVTSVAETGFGEIPRLAVFRAVLAVAGEPDIMSPRWEAVARDLQDRLHDSVPRTGAAVELAVRFLRERIGVPLAKFLPYSHQLLLLVTFFDRCPQPTDQQVDALRRWFWVTSWTSAFAGATSTTVRLALAEMADFAEGSGSLDPDTTGVQPMPEAFNLNSARTRAYVIWELMALPDRLDILGRPFDVVKFLATADTQVFRQVATKDSRPANRLVLPTTPGTTVRKALLELEPSLETHQILGSHGIHPTSWQRLKEGYEDHFLNDRQEFLEQRLRSFAKGMHVPLGDELKGIADDDTE